MAVLMKRFFPGFVVLCFLLASACKNKNEANTSKKTAPQQIPVVDVIIANPQKIVNTIEANGSIVASETVDLRPEISGRIIYLNIPEGTNIAQGTVIARMNDADLKAQQNKVKVQLDLAQNTVERYKKLLDIQGINKADYDMALNQVNSLNADMGILNAELAKTVVRAPFSGVIGLRLVSNGAYITPASILTTIQKIDKVKIDFTLPETYANSIKRGNTIEVETDNSAGKRQKATILAIEPQVSTTTRNLLVRAALLGGVAKPGTFVKVYIDAGEGAGILIPANAIIPDARAKKVVLVKNGKATFVEIETGLRQEGAVEVTRGLAGGDSVVVSGVLFARPNAPVKVRSVKQLAEVVN